MTIYVGNISYSITRKDLEDLFNQYGKVIKVTIPKDHERGRMKGYAFVEMEDTDETNVVSSLNNTQHMGRTLKVESAQSIRRHQ